MKNVAKKFNPTVFLAVFALLALGGTLLFSQFATPTAQVEASTNALFHVSNETDHSHHESTSISSAGLQVINDNVAELVAIADLPVIQGQLGFAPNAAPPVNRDYPALVQIEMVSVEFVAELMPGVEYKYWGFNDSVPGPMIRIREGDAVELNFRNAHDSVMPHNVDFHAVTGTGGGAEATFTLPGHETGIIFRALQPGVYIYHCATAPVGLHIANGMYGLIVVEPEEGFEPVDQEFYVVQSEFYTMEDFGVPGFQNFSQQRAVDEDPAYIVFNGEVGSLTGDNALRAEVGETIRMFFGNAGPNLTSSFHIIGTIFDKVWVEGGTGLINENVQTTLVPAGGATMVEMSMHVPATLTLVDHSIFRAFHKGTIGNIIVTGEGNTEIYSEQLYHRPFDPPAN